MRRTLVPLCALVLVVHLLSAAGTIFGIDGGRRFEVTQHLVEEGRVSLDSGGRSPIGADGRKYAQYALGHSLLMAPLYLAGKTVAAFLPSRRDEIVEFSVSLVNLLVTVTLVGVLANLARAMGFTKRTSVAVALIYAFATMGWQQAKDSFEHPQIALYFTALLYFLLQFANTRRVAHLWLAGLSLGLAVLTRYTSVLAAPAVAAFLVLHAGREPAGGRASAAARWILIIVAATLPFLCCDLVYNFIRFGHPLETGQQQLFGSLMSPGTFLDGLWGLAFSWQHGLFLFNPVLLLAFLGVARLWREQRDLTVAFLLLLATHFLFYSMTKEILWAGGWAWGPRMLVDVLPVLVLLCGPPLERVLGAGGRWPFRKAAVAALVGLSVLIQVESVLINPNRGCAEQSLGVHGHAIHSPRPRDSLLFIQAEGVWEISRNLADGKRPTQRKVLPELTPAALNETMSFGTFQLWWVYALFLGIRAPLVLSYVAASAAAAAGAALVLRTRVRAEATA